MQPIVAVYLLWGVWILTWLAAAMGTHHIAGKLNTFQDFIYKVAILAATFLIFTITPWPGLDVQYRLWDRSLDESWSWALLGVAFAGFGLAWWSTIHRLTVRKRHRDVIDTGPYAVVRHPMYVGLIIAAFATAVMFGRPSSLAGAALLTIAFIVRSIIEEQALREESFAFDDYMGRVPMLVPFFPTRDKPERPVPDHIPPTIQMMAEAPVITPRPTEPEPEPEPEPVASPMIVAVQDKQLGNDLGLAPSKAVQLSLSLDSEQPVMSDSFSKE